ncbi:MAG: hypothetical protein ACFFD2_22350 [Promethearchaeota archaeon]
MVKLRGIKLQYTKLIKKFWHFLEDEQLKYIQETLSPTEKIVLEETIKKKMEISDTTLKQRLKIIIKSLFKADKEKLINLVIELLTEEEAEEFSELLLNELLDLVHAMERKERKTLNMTGYG